MERRKPGERRGSLTPDERYQRSVTAKRRLRAVIKLILANLPWLQEIEDERLGDNVKRNIQMLTRKKGKKGLLTLRDKAVLNKPQELRTDAEKHHLNMIIGNLKCFRRYPPEIKNELPAIMYFNYWGPNRVIVKQDYEPINMYVIVSGEVVVTQTSYDRLLKEYVTKEVSLMGPGNYFGEVSLLHGINRTATVTTTQDSEFLYIKQDDFNRVLKQTVANQWAEIKRNMALFTYFENWTEVDIREACILAKKKYYEPEQIVLSQTQGQQDCVYFITSGSCYLIEHLSIETVYKKKIPHYYMAKERKSRSSDASSKEFNKSPLGILRSSLKSPTTMSEASVDVNAPKPEINVHFIKICTFSRLGCFNVGESLKNRIVISGATTECLVLPQYFLIDKAKYTFKAIERFLTRHIPNTSSIFQNFLEDRKWAAYKADLIGHILEHTKLCTGNSVHNVPYTIRLAEDLGEI